MAAYILLMGAGCAVRQSSRGALPLAMKSVTMDTTLYTAIDYLHDRNRADRAGGWFDPARIRCVAV